MENSKEMHYKILNSFTNHKNSSIVSEAKYNAIYSQGCLLDLPTPLKILTIKQMLKRIPATLAQVKAGKTSEKLLREIREIEQKKLLKIM